ncbi:hypothetical protein C5D36_10065 [Rathayibacter sp. AY1C6]|nr:hypothetical protein C5D36_10065 [Rathayibacter sp. AY1C6]
MGPSLRDEPDGVGPSLCDEPSRVGPSLRDEPSRVGPSLRDEPGGGVAQGVVLEWSAESVYRDARSRTSREWWSSGRRSRRIVTCGDDEGPPTGVDGP